MAEQQIFNVLIEFFEEDGWEFQWVEDAPVLSMGFSGHNGKWLCYAQARELEEQVVFYSVLSVNAPEEKRAKVAEFITRVNYGMVIGNFELDYEDGEIRYKTSIDVEGTELGASMVKQLVYANLVITDRYLPGIMRVLYSNESPVDVLDSIELEDLLDTTREEFNALFVDSDDYEDHDLYDDGKDDDFDDDFDDDEIDFDSDDFPPLTPPEIDGGSPN